MIRYIRTNIGTLIVTLCSSVAIAASHCPEASAQDTPYGRGTGPGTYYPQSNETQPGERGSTYSYEARGLAYGASLFVPIWNTEPEINPGIGIQLRGGWEFKSGFSILGNFGYMANPKETTGASINNGWLGGGFRYAFLNPSAFVPFIGGTAKLNFFQNCVRGDSIDTCEEDRRFAFGLNGEAGLAFELNSYSAVEAGLRIDTLFPGDAFELQEVYLSPFLGGTLYY